MKSSHLSTTEVNSINVKRLTTRLMPSHDRVLIRPFIPTDPNRIQRILGRIMSLPGDEVERELKRVLDDFSERHSNIERELLQHYELVRKWALTDIVPDDRLKLVIGAYFTQEYSLESAALFNPSIVPHPNQRDLGKGAQRFILSLRATGEGHVSSIVFREGIIEPDFSLSIRKPTPFVTEPDKVPNVQFEKALFSRKLVELDAWNDISQSLLNELPKHFRLRELEEAIKEARRNGNRSPALHQTLETVLALALSNYEVQFSPDQRTSERAIFPASPSQRNGIEDARFVLFTDDDGKRKYYATFTAFDGNVILPQLMETDDFLNFRFVTLNGPGVKNKGMALFPRRINGCFAMLSRQDNENIFLMYSDNIHFWYDPIKIVRPTYSWEYVQLGNCGSPIELDEGWLVLSHGVGPMRRYCIGAFLLDRDDPTRLIGRLKQPLLQPNENEREGYVPNVVYTCGAMVYREKLLLPYAMSDYATAFAIIDVAEILRHLS